VGKTVDSEGYLTYSGLFWRFALPQFIVPLYGLLTAGALVIAAARADATLLSVGSGFAGGVLFWTFFEYVLHRWMLHNRSTPFWKKYFWEALHKEHHLLHTMQDKDHHGIHPRISLPINLAVLLVFGFGPAWLLAFAAGWVFGYLAYEGLHWVFHGFERGRGPLRIKHLQWLCDMHEVHHLVDARRNYGFVTMLWDRVFRTFKAL
jgi:sterol desaturase/sphingolipid hydroxylase (fatty acid hydroxylase superfamily)